MGMDVTIRQKGLFKKTLPLEVILGDKLAYGAFDGLRTEVGAMGEEDFIAFHPEHIGRGFSVEWKKDEKNEVRLRIPMPTPAAELSIFYDTVKRITDYWNCTLELDGEKMTPAEFQAGHREKEKANKKIIKDAAETVSAGQNESLTFYCAKWPVVMGRGEAKCALNDEMFFEKWLHGLQEIKAYYAKPNFFRSEEGIVGQFFFSENSMSIFPIAPAVPLGIVDPETEKPLKCENYTVALFSLKEEKMLAEIPYRAFLSAVGRENVRYFDVNHALIKPFTSEELAALRDKTAINK